MLPVVHVLPVKDVIIFLADDLINAGRRGLALIKHERFRASWTGVQKRKGRFCFLYSWV